MSEIVTKRLLLDFLCALREIPLASGSNPELNQIFCGLGDKYVNALVNLVNSMEEI